MAMYVTLYNMAMYVTLYNMAMYVTLYNMAMYVTLYNMAMYAVGLLKSWPLLMLLKLERSQSSVLLLLMRWNVTVSSLSSNLNNNNM